MHIPHQPPPSANCASARHRRPVIAQTLTTDWGDALISATNSLHYCPASFAACSSVFCTCPRGFFFFVFLHLTTQKPVPDRPAPRSRPECRRNRHRAFCQINASVAWRLRGGRCSEFELTFKSRGRALKFSDLFVVLWSLPNSAIIGALHTSHVYIRA